jgi:uncharacterized protein (TIGR02246 family)
MEPTQIVQQQLEAYNRRDIEGFIRVFAEDATGYELGSAAPMLTGRAAIRARYEQLFANSPKLHSDVVTRVALGRTVIDLERITGRNGSDQVVDLMLIYEVIEGRIQRFHVARP